MEDVDPKLSENASKIMLRIKVNTIQIVKELQKYNLYDPREGLCFNFDFSLFVDDVDIEGDVAHLTDNKNNKLIRADWHGKEQAANAFDTSGRINVFLTFEKSLSH